MAKASVNFKPCKGATGSLLHNERIMEPDYLLGFSDRKENKSQFREGLEFTDVVDLEQEYLSKFSRQAKQAKTSPFFEGVMNLDENLSNEELATQINKWSKGFEEKTNMKVLYFAIHQDEGYKDLEAGQVKRNCHAHIIIDRVNRDLYKESGKVKMIKLNNLQLREIQDLTAKETGLERGVHVEESKREYLTHQEWKKAKIALEQGALERPRAQIYSKALEEEKEKLEQTRQQQEEKLKLEKKSFEDKKNQDLKDIEKQRNQLNNDVEAARLIKEKIEKEIKKNQQVKKQLQQEIEETKKEKELIEEETKEAKKERQEKLKKFEEPTLEEIRDAADKKIEKLERISSPSEEERKNAGLEKQRKLDSLEKYTNLEPKKLINLGVREKNILETYVQLNTIGLSLSKGENIPIPVLKKVMLETKVALEDLTGKGDLIDRTKEYLQKKMKNPAGMYGSVVGREKRKREEEKRQEYIKEKTTEDPDKGFSR